VHLLDLLAVRADPAAGLYLSLTRRCPLHCAHCSTSSTMRSEQLDEAPFRTMVESFAGAQPPRLIWMTGGEPLLRPRLVSDLAIGSRRSGVASALLTGAWFAASPRPPREIQRALRVVDHVSVSIDRYHEREVPRTAVLALLGELLAEGRDVSVHLTGDRAGEPYLDQAVEEIRSALGDRCPIHVSLVGAAGRARDWLAPAAATGPALAAPCRLAAWPVVAFDGTVVACCSQLAIDGPVPAHLRLGDATDGWPAIRRRALARPMLRAIRTFGPRWIAEQDGAGDCGGYCETCLTLSADAGVADRVASRMARPQTALLERHAAAGRPSRARWLDQPAYAHLLELGYPVAV
jgi:pyruvate-formate lyase-activating enzyme